MWNRLGTKLIPKLRSGTELKAEVSFSVSLDGKAVASFESELRQILEDLGLGRQNTARQSLGVKKGTGYFYVDCRSEGLVGTALSDPYLEHACYRRFHAANFPVIHYIDANTMQKLSDVGDGLIKLCQLLNDRGDKNSIQAHPHHGSVEPSDHRDRWTRTD